MYLSDILTGSCQSWKKKCDNSIQITWTYQKRFWGGKTPLSPAATFRAWLWWGVEHLLQPCFKHDRRMYLSDILPGSCQSWKKKCDNSIQITWAYQKNCGGGEPRSPVVMFQACLGWGIEPCSPATMFQSWQTGVLIQCTTRQLSVVTKEAW